MRLYQIQVQKYLQVIWNSVIGLHVPKMGTKTNKNYEDIITWNSGRNASVQLRNNGSYRCRLFGRQ